MKVTRIIAALVFGMFLALGTVVGVSAQDDTMKAKQDDTKMMKTKSTHHMMKHHHMMAKKHHKMKKHHMMKKTMEPKAS